MKITKIIGRCIGDAIGWIISTTLAIVARVVVFPFILMGITVYIIVAPFGVDNTPNWFNKLFEWYAGK